VAEAAAGGGTPAAAPSAPSGGQAGQGTSQGGGNAAPATAERGRIGDFSSWSSITPAPQPAQTQTTFIDPAITSRAEGDSPEYIADDFAPIDAEGRALALDDSAPSEVMTPEQAAEWRKEYDAWKAADDLPEPFLQKFGVATIDGQRYRIPVAEAFAGYQRNSDYSNKLRQVYAFQAQLQQQFRGLQALLSDLDDGQRFIDAMVALKKFPGFHKAAVIYGAQLAAEQAMTPEQRAIVAQNRALRAQNQELMMRMNALSAQAQQVQQQQPAPDAQVYMNQLAQMWPRAAQAIGWVDSPAARREFELHWDNMLPALEGRELTTDFVAQVMQAAMESIQAHLRAANPALLPPPQAAPRQQQQQQRPPAPPGRGLPGPAPSVQNGGRQPTRARISDLSTMVGRR